MDLDSSNKKHNGLRVYVTAIPTDARTDLTRIACEQRRAEIEKIKNPRVKAEKLFAWLLLEYAVKADFGCALSSLNPRKTDSGKWVADRIFFSISHSDGIIAVAVSDKPVGVDIQGEVVPRAKNFAEKVLNERELSELSELTDKDKSKQLIELWSKKEALFKLDGDGVFSPKKIDTKSFVSFVQINEAKGTSILSVASRDYTSFELSCDVDLHNFSG